MVENVSPDRVVISINEKLRPLQPLSSGCCIYRVPENLRTENRNAYHPWVVLIGPFHHGDARLEPMQEHKLRYLQSFLKRKENNNIDHYVQLVRDRLQRIRNCYNEQFHLDDDSFVEMVLLDAAFIIEFLISSVESEITADTNFMGYGRNLMNQITCDMLLLEENQLPLFVLNDIYEVAFPHFSEGIHFILLANLLLPRVNISAIEDVTENTEVKHFADLLWLSCLPSKHETKPDHIDHDFKMITYPPTATVLEESGVKFKVSKSERLLDISYKNGTLYIPRLHLGTHSETFFRNLILFEERQHPSLYYYIFYYIIFLDSLIDTGDDVDVLVRNGIIHNGLRDNFEAAMLINRLGTHIGGGDEFYYSDVSNALNEYMANKWHKYVTIKWHKWMGILMSKYFSHPWAAMSVFYAIVLLILTILQVITGFIQIRDSRGQPVN